MIFYLMISLDEYSLQEKKAKIDGTKNREERVSRHERMMVTQLSSSRTYATPV
jgi:hypothetical protein